jgi:hypothetical protein
MKPCTTHSARVNDISPLPEEDAPVDWWGPFAEDVSGDEGGTCCCGWDGGGGGPWHYCVSGGGGGRCCGKDCRTSSGLPCGG